MRYIYFIIGVALLIFLIVITIRYYLVKKQIRLFSDKIKEKTSTDSREPLKTQPSMTTFLPRAT